MTNPDEIKTAADQRSLAKRVDHHATAPEPASPPKPAVVRTRSVSLVEKYKPQMDELRSQVKAKRQKANLTFRQLSKLTGISPSTLCRFEMGSEGIRAEMLLAIQDWLKGR